MVHMDTDDVYVEPRHPGDCLCSECSADSTYEYWLDDDYEQFD